jgi:glycosyltransferase involved in cell wall biosynthesis
MAAIDDTSNLVSVILPTRNRQQLLAAAVASVRRQTYTCWELIIIDDASEDTTGQLIAQLTAEDNRISAIRLSQQTGGAYARNIGLEAARGAYVAFLDDDDAWYPEKLAVQKTFLDANQDVAVVSAGFCRIRDHRTDRISRRQSVTLKDLQLETTLGSFTFCMVRSSDLGRSRIDPELKACQDWDLWLKILRTTGKRGEIIPECLADYDRTTKNSLTWQQTQALRARIVFLHKIWPDLNRGQKIYHLVALALRRAVASERQIRPASRFLHVRFFVALIVMIRAIGVRSALSLGTSLLPKACGRPARNRKMISRELKN